MASKSLQASVSRLDLQGWSPEHTSPRAACGFIQVGRPISGRQNKGPLPSLMSELLQNTTMSRGEGGGLEALQGTAFRLLWFLLTELETLPTPCSV